MYENEVNQIQNLHSNENAADEMASGGIEARAFATLMKTLGERATQMKATAATRAAVSPVSPFSGEKPNTKLDVVAATDATDALSSALLPDALALPGVLPGASSIPAASISGVPRSDASSDVASADRLFLDLLDGNNGNHGDNGDGGIEDIEDGVVVVKKKKKAMAAKAAEKGNSLHKGVVDPLDWRAWTPTVHNNAAHTAATPSIPTSSTHLQQPNNPFTSTPSVPASVPWPHGMGRADGNGNDDGKTAKTSLSKGFCINLACPIRARDLQRVLDASVLHSSSANNDNNDISNRNDAAAWGGSVAIVALAFTPAEVAAAVGIKSTLERTRPTLMTFVTIRVVTVTPAEEASMRGALNKIRRSFTFTDRRSTTGPIEGPSSSRVEKTAQTERGKTAEEKGDSKGEQTERREVEDAAEDAVESYVFARLRPRLQAEALSLSDEVGT